MDPVACPVKDCPQVLWSEPGMDHYLGQHLFTHTHEEVGHAVLQLRASLIVESNQLKNASAEINRLKGLPHARS